MPSTWNYSTAESFELFDLHDSPVTAISVQADEIQLQLAFMNVLRGHPANEVDRARCTGQAVLRFKGVTASNAVLFRDKEAEDHPEPTNPIRGDLVETSVVGNGTKRVFLLAGNHEDADGRYVGWVEWRITAEEFALMWDTYSGDAWFELPAAAREIYGRGAEATGPSRSMGSSDAENDSGAPVRSPNDRRRSHLR